MKIIKEIGITLFMAAISVIFTGIGLAIAHFTGLSTGTVAICLVSALTAEYICRH